MSFGVDTHARFVLQPCLAFRMFLDISFHFPFLVEKTHTALPPTCCHTPRESFGLGVKYTAIRDVAVIVFGFRK